MEPTHKLIIAMLVAYVPFIWYFISLAIKEANQTESDKRKKERRREYKQLQKWDWKE